MAVRSFGSQLTQAFAAVDQVFFVQANKDFFHGIGKPLVHGEALRSQSTELPRRRI